MSGVAVMTSLMLPLSGDLFDPPAEAVVDNLLIALQRTSPVLAHRVISLLRSNRVALGAKRTSTRLSSCSS